jgi:hypothetical protein
LSQQCRSSLMLKWRMTQQHTNQRRMNARIAGGGGNDHKQCTHVSAETPMSSSTWNITSIEAFNCCLASLTSTSCCWWIGTAGVLVCRNVMSWETQVYKFKHMEEAFTR